MARFRRIQRSPELQAKLTKLRKAPNAGVQSGLLRAGEIVSKEQKRLAPEQTGDMKAANKVTLTTSARTGNQAVRVSNSDFKAAWVEFGTKGHNIRPKNRKVLQLGPDEFVSGEVKHPGTRAQPWFFPGYRAKRRSARTAIGKGVRDSIVKAAK